LLLNFENLVVLSHSGFSRGSQNTSGTLADWLAGVVLAGSASAGSVSAGALILFLDFHLKCTRESICCSSLNSKKEKIKVHFKSPKTGKEGT
jgi:hypothetical protein